MSLVLAYLSLGSNLDSQWGDRAATLTHAIELLKHVGEVTKVSSFYETEPVGFAQQPWFINCAVELRTELDPRGLLNAALAIERAMGRHRASAPPKGPRLIDIDILLYDDRSIHGPGLQIPHPAIRDRRFVLEPLAEINAHEDVARMLQECTDRSAVRKLP